MIPRGGHLNLVFWGGRGPSEKLKVHENNSKLLSLGKFHTCFYCILKLSKKVLTVIENLYDSLKIQQTNLQIQIGKSAWCTCQKKGLKSMPRTVH